MPPLLSVTLAAILAGAALVLAFFRKAPAVALAFVAMIVAAAGPFVFSAATLWFWGAATALALAIQYLAPIHVPARLRAYTVGAALTGAVVGLAFGSTAAVIIGACVGAFLGFIAFRRTPEGRELPSRSAAVQVLAPCALPAVVNFSILMLIFSQLIQL